MTEPRGNRHGSSAGDSWEQRAAGLASEIQRWLIRTSARSMRDEMGGQVRKMLRSQEPPRGDAWATATTESPHAADEPPECAWCPVCRAARRMSQAKAAGPEGRGGPRLSDAADVMAAAVRDALAGLEAMLSYRPPADPGGPAETSADRGPQSGADQTEEPEDEPGDRG